MPILKSAFKRVRADKKRKLRNMSVKSELKTLSGKVEELIKAAKYEPARKAAAELISKLDKAAARGIIHKKTASRKKSRVAVRIAKLKG